LTSALPLLGLCRLSDSALPLLELFRLSSSSWTSRGAHLAKSERHCSVNHGGSWRLHLGQPLSVPSQSASSARASPSRSARAQRRVPRPIPVCSLCARPRSDRGSCSACRARRTSRGTFLASTALSTIPNPATKSTAPSAPRAPKRKAKPGRGRAKFEGAL